VPAELKKKMEKTGDVNWSEVAREAFEEEVKRKEMREASEAIDRIREKTRMSGWSGAKEIRRWRDTDTKS